MPVLRFTWYSLVIHMVGGLRGPGLRAGPVGKPQQSLRKRKAHTKNTSHAHRRGYGHRARTRADAHEGFSYVFLSQRFRDRGPSKTEPGPIWRAVP